MLCHFLPGRLNKGRRQASTGEALTGTVEHRLGGFGQRDIMALLRQPETHMAEPGTDIQHPQRPLRQHLGKVRLEHGEADRAFGATIDLLRETGGQLVEMAIVHGAKRRSLSASLASNACSISIPSSLHISSRYIRMSPTSCPACSSLSAGSWRDWSSVSHWKISTSSAISTLAAMARFLGL